MQAGERRDEIPGLCGLLHPHCTGHPYETLVADVPVDEEREVSPAEHDQPGAVGQILVVGRHGVFHRVLAGRGAQAHHHAGKGVAEGHAGPSFEIVAIGHGARQVAGDMLDGGQCVHVACEVGEFRNVTLHAVEQCVEPLVCREFRRHGEHQLRIDYGQYGKSGFDADLFMGLFVGYDSPRVDFRPGSCRRGYGDERLFFARPAENVVPQVAVVGCHQGYGLRGVHDAAASQCDDHVAPVLPCRCRSGHDGGFQGVRFDPVEYHAFDPCQPELFLRGGQIAGHDVHGGGLSGSIGTK